MTLRPGLSLLILIKEYKLIWAMTLYIQHITFNTKQLEQHLTIKVTLNTIYVYIYIQTAKHAKSIFNQQHPIFIFLFIFF
jgi:hypothetical protein